MFWLKIHGFMTTNTAVVVPTFRLKYYFFVDQMIDTYIKV